MSNPTMKGMNRGYIKKPKERANARKRAVAGVKRADEARQKTGKNLWGENSTVPTSQAKLKKLGFCGAKKRRQDAENGATLYCQKKAGWGTDHPGMGRCKYHGGMTAMQHAAEERKYQIEFMGRPKEISPLDAIIWAIKITAGEVEWLSTMIAEINTENEWIEHTIQGKQLHVFQRARAEAMDRLVKYSKDAIALGLAERAIRMAEQFGMTIARMLEGIADDLGLTRQQRTAWPVIVRKHLIMMEGGGITDEDRKEVKALTSGK